MKKVSLVVGYIFVAAVITMSFSGVSHAYDYGYSNPYLERQQQQWQEQQELQNQREIIRLEEKQLRLQQREEFEDLMRQSDEAQRFFQDN